MFNWVYDFFHELMIKIWNDDPLRDYSLIDPEIPLTDLDCNMAEWIRSSQDITNIPSASTAPIQRISGLPTNQRNIRFSQNNPLLERHISGSQEMRRHSTQPQNRIGSSRIISGVPQARPLTVSLP